MQDNTGTGYSNLNILTVNKGQEHSEEIIDEDDKDTPDNEETASDDEEYDSLLPSK